MIVFMPDFWQNQVINVISLIIRLFTVFFVVSRCFLFTRTILFSVVSYLLATRYLKPKYVNV